MPKYETMLITSTKLDEEATTAVVDKFKALIEANGSIDAVDEWGKRRLAYPINKEEDGVYTLIHFESGADFPAELDRVYKITDGVLRSLIIVKDEVMIKAEEAARAKAEADAKARAEAEKKAKAEAEAKAKAEAEAEKAAAEEAEQQAAAQQEVETEAQDAAQQAEAEQEAAESGLEQETEAEANKEAE